jgi:hypothetical protein
LNNGLVFEEILESKHTTPPKVRKIIDPANQTFLGRLQRSSNNPFITARDDVMITEKNIIREIFQPLVSEYQSAAYREDAIKENVRTINEKRGRPIGELVVEHPDGETYSIFARREIEANDERIRSTLAPFIREIRVVPTIGTDRVYTKAQYLRGYNTLNLQSLFDGTPLSKNLTTVYTDTLKRVSNKDLPLWFKTDVTMIGGDLTDPQKRQTIVTNPTKNTG